MGNQSRQDPVINSKPLRALAGFIFFSRWLQAPLYLGLIVAQGVYVYHFMVELNHLVHKTTSITEIDIMLIVLGLIDVVMIAHVWKIIHVRPGLSMPTQVANRNQAGSTYPLPPRRRRPCSFAPPGSDSRRPSPVRLTFGNGTRWPRRTPPASGRTCSP